MNIYQKLTEIQNSLKVPKEQENKFGGYKYRSAEDIQEKVKPLLQKYETTLYLSDEIELIGDRTYVKATATLTDGEDCIVSTAYAREPEAVKGQSEAQITGASSSYARKYALNGLFQLDDTKDPDATNKHGKEEAMAKDMDKLGKLVDLFNAMDKSRQEVALKRYKINDIAELPVELWDKVIGIMSK